MNKRGLLKAAPFLASFILFLVAVPEYATSRTQLNTSVQEDNPDSLPDNMCYLVGDATHRSCCNISWFTQGASDYVAARSDNRNGGIASGPIDVPVSSNNPKLRACRYVDNIAPASIQTSYFIPFRSPIEWSAFLTNPPENIRLVPCARPATYVLEPDSRCVSPSPAPTDASAMAQLDYARFGTRLSFVAAYNCAGNMMETVQTSFNAATPSPDGEIHPDPGWRQDISTTRYDTGECGSAHGVAVDTAPTANLCIGNNIVASTVAGGSEGPWSWTCTMNGTNTTASITCNAPTAKAECGAAAGVVASTKPTQNLCAGGSATEVTGSGPWKWDCISSEKQVSCTAPSSLNATCGAANGAPVYTAPTTDLCDGGTASAVSSGPPWKWTCTAGTLQANCEAPPGGWCGSISRQTVYEQPVNNLCRYGTARDMAYRIENNTSLWSWKCYNLEKYDSCIAGNSATCGWGAHIKPSDTGPSGSLCYVGSGSTVVDKGSYFEWTCVAQDKSSQVSCSVAKPQTVSCGTSGGGVFTNMPTTELCQSGATASAVEGSGPWTWTCTSGATSIPCSASKSYTVACGSADGKITTSQPTQGLCVSPSYDENMVKIAQGNGQWVFKWNCTDGTHSVTCSAPKCECAMCGTAAGIPSTTAPTKNLCGIGTLLAPGVIGEALQWTWYCDDSATNSKHICHAPKN